MAVQHSDDQIRLTYLVANIVRFGAELPVAPRYLSSRRKRLIDLVFGSSGVLLLAIVFPFVALAIKLNSPGPVLYRQRRIGLNGEPFELIKFRTMTVDAERENGAVWAKRNDPRVTSVGRYLRRLYIDEFPQWWNVLTGQMSVVGPRPERPEMIGQILDFVFNFNRRLLAKPGITGVAQVN
jgi:lipopolysaccharide/colanic/teichoic acid biosynthesis glycosyltransferase